MNPRSVTARRPPVTAGRVAAVMALVGVIAALAVVTGHSLPEAHAVAQGAGRVTLVPILDNTLYEESGNRSNGAGQYLFSGRTGNRNNGASRRALLSFDVAANVPAGSTITGAALTLRVTRSNTSIQTTRLHKVQAGWGQGAFNAASLEGSGAGATTGDATWIHSYFNASTWQTPGGDYSPTVSASAEVGQPLDDAGKGPGKVTWTSAQMVADAQAWLDGPTTNFGWILVGNEAQLKTAKRFDSRENPTSSNRPY